MAIQTLEVQISKPTFRLHISVSSKFDCSSASEGLESADNAYFFRALPLSPPQRPHLRENPEASCVGASLPLSSAGREQGSERHGGCEQRTPLLTSQLPA